MRLPDEIRMRVLADGKPMPSALVMLKIIMLYKNDFLVIAGPTNQIGTCVITRKEILKQCEYTIGYAIMDYGDPEGGNSGKMLLNAVGFDELKTLEVTFREWPYPFPMGFAENLEQAHKLVYQISPTQLDVEAETIGGEMVISSITSLHSKPPSA